MNTNLFIYYALNETVILMNDDILFIRFCQPFGAKSRVKKKNYQQMRTCIIKTTRFPSLKIFLLRNHSLIIAVCMKPKVKFPQ